MRIFTDANKIGKISRTTGEVTEYPIPTANSGPSGITLGPDGGLWFTESLADKIGKISVKTGIITEYDVLTGNSQVTGITSGPDDNLWFTESMGNKIGKVGR